MYSASSRKNVRCGVTQYVSDMCLYWKRDYKKIVVVGFYVDDLLVTGSNVAAVEWFFEGMSSLSI